MVEMVLRPLSEAKQMTEHTSAKYFETPGASIILYNIQHSFFNDFSMGKRLQTHLLAPKNTQFGLWYTLMYGFLSK